MRSTLQLFQLLVEFIFILLGGFLAWIALTQHYFFYPRSMPWLLLAGLVIVLGMMAFFARAPAANRAAAAVRGGSFIIVGFVMLALARAPMRWANSLLLLAGLVLGLRGFIGVFFALRRSK